MIWVRRPDDSRPRVFIPGAEPPGPKALVGIAEDTAHQPVAVALHDARVREALARVITVPSLAGRRRLRLAVLGLAVVGLSGFALGAARTAEAWVPAAVLVSAVVRELRRRTPDIPATAGAALVALGLAAAVKALATCGHGANAPLAAASALLVAGALLLVSPGRDRVVLELGDRLGLSREDVRLGEVEARRGRVMPVHAGLALALALVGADRAFLRGGIDLARCLARLDADSAAAFARDEAARRALLVTVRSELGPLVLWLLVLPVASEVLRYLLLTAASRRLQQRSALLATSVAYGVLHALVLHAPLSEGVLLGLAFGVTMVEGGITAAVVAHLAFRAIALF